MSATGSDGIEPAPEAGSDSSEDQRYFLAIEDLFIRLRGAPLLLSPADWRTAQEWRRQGIPLPLIESTLEEIFERRQERGATGMVSSLRYCKRAVEAAWKEARELSATAQRTAAPALEAAPRLAALAEALPADLPRREGVAARIRGLGSLVGEDPEKVEAALARLEEDLLDELEPSLEPSRRETLAAAEKTALDALAGRLPRDQIEAARQRLHRQLLREELGLPVLSLFAVGME